MLASRAAVPGHPTPGPDDEVISLRNWGVLDPASFRPPILSLNGRTRSCLQPPNGGGRTSLGASAPGAGHAIPQRPSAPPQSRAARDCGGAGEGKSEESRGPGAVKESIPKSEVRRTKSEERSPKNEVRRTEAEIRRTKSDLRSPNSEVRTPNSEWARALESQGFSVSRMRNIEGSLP